jgi:hypothetical protein
MQSAIIIYHSESILEMQFMCLICFTFVFEQKMPPEYHMNKEAHAKSNLILFSLVVEHIFAYFSGLFRVWEIKHYGKLDINGVARAQKETFLKTFEVFMDCLIFGFTINHIFSLSWKDFQDHPYVHFWMIIDFMVMFLTLSYVYMTKLMIINSEITKNIYSLHFIQD